MMTDGAVDVHRNTQQYGSRLAARRADRDQPADGRREAGGVQLWPLGFGADVGTGVTQAQA